MTVQADNGRQQGIFGRGRLGCALARSLEQVGHQVMWFDSRDGLDARAREELERCDLVFLCIQDDALGGLVERLSQPDIPPLHAVSMSGNTPINVLEPLMLRGGDAAKLHPLLSFSRIKNDPIPPDTHFAFTSTPHLKDRLISLITAWHGVAHELTTEQWPLYHLAATLASNFLPLWIRVGAHLLEPVAGTPKEAMEWLRALVTRSAADALDAENPCPFSGPAIRGDDGVIASHVALLNEIAPSLTALYQENSSWIRHHGKALDKSRIF